MALHLAELPDGAHATVLGLVATSPDLDPAMLRRLGELGFITGEPLQLLRRGPAGREPLVVRVGDSLFALRRLASTGRSRAPRRALNAVRPGSA